MNQIYFKARYLYFLLGFFVCSIGLAQSPFQKIQNTNVPTAVGNPSKNQTADPIFKKNNSSKQDDTANALFGKREETKGIELSQEESESIKRQIAESQKILGQNLSEEKKTQDSTKVRSFAKSANLTAKNIFEVKKADFELSKSDQMELKSISENHGRILVTYQQLHNSIPVEGAIFKVRENKTKIDAFGQTSKKITAASTYKVNENAALENALKSVNAKEYVWESKKISALVNKKISGKPKGELVYVGPNFSSELKEYLLAWKFDVFAINPQSSQTIYVDANTGRIILTIDLNRDVHVKSDRIEGNTQRLGSGKSRYSGDVTFNTKQYADGFKLEADQGKFGVPIYTLNMNHYNSPSDEIITEFVDEDNVWNELHNKDHDEVAIDIHWGMQKTIDYFAEKFNRNSVDNKGMTVFGLAHLGKNVDNASWTGGWAQFGDGVDNAPYVGLGITAHELTHAVTQFSAGLIYRGESGAMNESFSDIFGISTEFYVGKDSKEKIWLLGDELYKHGSMRNMANPKAQNQPDTYGGKNWANPTVLTFDNGGVHINSGITNYWFYLLCEGGKGTNDNNQSYDVKPIGLAKAEKIAYLTLTEYLSPSSNFYAMRQASLMAVEDLYGLNSEEYKQVTNAWYAIGVGSSFSDKQISIVSIENPTVECGSLNGNEPFYVKVKNTGSAIIKADEILNYKLRSMIEGFGGRYSTLYTHDGSLKFTKDLAVGEESIIKIQDNIVYNQSLTAPTFVEVKFDFKPIQAFGTKDGTSFITSLLVKPSQKDYDITAVGLNFPVYTGQILSANHPLAINLYNLGCIDIPAGAQLKIGYLNKSDGSQTVWKDITLETAFKKNSEMTIPFNANIDLSAQGLHTYECFVVYNQDVVTANNNAISAVYSGVVNQFPYNQDFEITPGGWYSNALKGNQKFKWQPSSVSFRDLKSKYAWVDVDLSISQKLPANSDFTLESPIFDFSNVVSPYIEFDMAYLFAKGAEGLIIEYSDENGQNWKKAADVNYSETVHTNDLAQGPWFTGVNTLYSKDPYQIRLNELKGKKAAIRFRVLTDKVEYGYIGAVIDNIMVSDAPFDLEVLTASLDAGKCTIDNNRVTINTKITNNFITQNQNVVVELKILDSMNKEVFSKSEKTTLAFAKFKDTISYSISNIDLKSIGANTIIVSVFPEDITKEAKPKNNSFAFGYDNWKNEDMKVSVLPYTMDFEDDTKYKGWRTSENKNSTGWQHGTSDELRSPGWPVSEHTHFMASNDDKCNCDASNDMLISPVFDLSNYKTAHLTFDGFGDSQGLSDGFVKISTDGGVTWETKFKMPYLSRWFEYYVDLSAYAGKSCVQVAFQHNDNGLFANGFAVDNIRIKEVKDRLELSNLSVPEKVYEDATSHEFFISVKNIFYNSTNKINIEYQITQNGNPIGEPIVLEKEGELLVYQTLVYKIDGIPHLPVGKYEINVKVTSEGQPKSEAQNLKGAFEVIANAPTLDIENFSNVAQGSLFGSNGYTSNQSDENYPWRNVVAPDNIYLSFPKKDHTGDVAAKMLYNQLEGYARYGELISPVYKLSDKAAALEFFYALQSNYLNAFIIDIKTLGGEWKELWRDSKQGTYGDTNWQKGTINIKEYAGKSVMLRFRHAKAGGFSYMIFDDLKVINAPILDVSLQLLSPKDVCGGDQVKVKLINEGQVAIVANAVQVNLEYTNTKETISEVVENEIPVGGNIEYTFKKQPKQDQSGDSHVYNLIAKLENDVVPSNNEVKNYTYQNVGSDFRIFDNPAVYGYQGTSLYVDAATNFNFRKLDVASYKWNTGEVSNNIEIREPGNYTVTAVLKNGCTLTETVKAVFSTFVSELPSGNVCGPEVVLNPGNYASYVWFDGSTDPTFVTKENGEYYVTVYNENGIGKTFSTKISILENKVPEIKVTGDKKLTASIEATSYQWFLNERPIPNANEKSIITIWEGNYSLQTTNEGGCSNMSELFDSRGMLIGKITNAFRVFPNPIVDNVNLFLADRVEGGTQIKIYAMDGKEVWSKSFNAFPTNINVSGLIKGVYILECVLQNKKYTTKIIKN
ncbi:MAG: M4 family metallopeptidase [Flavobacterium sp.]|uniref:M4 family metallopeptidase n=1 Tax=Flavobacterium sp. TaxID=239 RepID=UPI001B1D1446|nr:M4 family metallopeptidase [Flavobacterium sp.]MBO9584276.1 M4 family metallopeptidase [Flavobacterium sp.]